MFPALHSSQPPPASGNSYFPVSRNHHVITADREFSQIFTCVLDTQTHRPVAIEWNPTWHNQVGLCQVPDQVYTVGCYTAVLANSLHYNTVKKRVD